MAAKSDYYDILGVNKTASANDIKSDYRKKAIEWHPDKHKDKKEEAELKFKEINEAYQILSDPQKRQAYDQFGHQAFAPGGAASGFGGQNPFAGRQGAGGFGPFTYTYTTNGGGGSPFSGFDFGDPFEIFESFFGGSGGPFGRVQRKPRYSISIDFMDAVKGTVKEAQIEGKKRKIKIPPGVDDGSRISFDDFILSINVKPHDIFERDGSDVYVREFIPFSLAGLGGQIKVPTVEGSVKIKVKAGTKSGTMVRLRGKGIQSLHGRGKGDQYVKFVIAVPEKLSRKQKSLFKELQEEGF